MNRPTSLSELIKSGYKSRSVKEELRSNLIARIQKKQPLFEGIHGYEAVSYTHLRAHETVLDLVCRLLLEKKKKHNSYAHV